MLINNRYQILRSLGSGGFGETFIAEDTQMPSGRRCVLKKLHPVSNDQHLHQLVKERFQREAAILEDLGNQCDRIPTLYAYFEEDNNFYLVQELIDGITLNDLVRQQSSFSESYVKDFLANLLPVLEYVHTKHIIHRDVKPDNIIMRRQDHKPILIDFGAVKEAMSTNVGISGNSINTIMIGTPGFMPSEQAAGRPLYSSDLYATGLTAVYLLTGRMPQNIETDYSTGEVLWKQYAPEVSPTFANILDKIISPHARDRYATAKEVIQALQSQTLEFEPTVIVSPRQILPQSAISPSQSKFGEFQKTLLIGGFLSLGIVLGFWVTRQPQQSTPILDSQTTTSAPASPDLPKSEQPSPSVTPPPSEIPTISPEKTPPITSENPIVAIAPNNPDPTEQKNIPTQTTETTEAITPTSPVVTNSTPNQPAEEVLNVDTAKQVIQNLYAHVSNQEWNNARNQFTPELSSQFDPSFFKQFNRVTIEDLNLTSKTNKSISFIGTTTYFYRDGSKQTEERSYTIQMENKIPLITASEFIGVVKSR